MANPRTRKLAPRHKVALTADGEIVLLATSPSKVLSIVIRKTVTTYAALSKATGLSRSTLYVYLQRMHNAGLVYRETTRRNGRDHTDIWAVEGVEANVKVRRI